MSEHKTDLLRECMSSTGLESGAQSVEEFSIAFCRRCWHIQCVRAEQADLPWEDRMATQVYRLLDHPNFAALNDPRFSDLRKISFKDMYQNAMRIEIANRRGDWEVPVLPGEELKVLASKEATDHVEEALLALERARSKPTAPITAEEPIPEPKPAPEPELTPEPEVRPEVRPERHRGQGQQVNTDFPVGGAMVGGDPVPPSSLVPRDGFSKEAVDPWAPPPKESGTKIDVGGTIVLGSPRKK